MAAGPSALASPPVPTDPPQASTSGTFFSPKMSTDSAASLKKSRTLILCFDGTANQYDGDNTNVVKLYALLKKDNTDEQLCYYQPGVGTYFQPGVVQPIFQWGAKMLDEAVAWYLNAHVQGGYTFLMQNYCPGDKICIFGFSRGAYTARALAGMLHKIGLLPKDNPEQVPLAYKLYQNNSKDSRALAAGFKETFCRSVTIEFVGVWDTVASVGVLRSRTLPFTTTNTTIKTFRHALSLDEHRAKFQPNLYHRLTPDASATVADLTAIQEDDSVQLASPVSAKTDMSFQPLVKDPKEKAVTETVETVENSNETAENVPQSDSMPKQPTKEKWGKKLLKKLFSRKASGRLGKSALHGDNIVNPLNDPADDFVGQTDVKEVWFAGCHSDVGGGAVTNTTANALADITLRWMVRQVVQTQCGIAFDSEALERADIPNSVFTGEGFPATTGSPAAAPARRSPRRNPIVVPPDTCGDNDNPSGSPNGAQNGGRRKGQKQLEAFGYGRASAESDASRASSEDSGVSAASRVDALEPIHDELVLDKWWWLLEIVPTNYTWQDGSGQWHSKWSLHLGKGRKIPSKHPLFHETVKERMNDKDLKYKPRATWTAGMEEYVD